MDRDIEIWKNKQKLAEYCGECGGSGQQHVHLTGNRKIDFETCQYCKGTGRPINRKMKASAYDRATKPWINEFETQTITNEKDIQQPQETGIGKHNKLATVPGSIQQSRQRDFKEEGNKKPGFAGYAIPGARGENNPVLCHPGEVRQLHEKKNSITL